MKQGSHRCHELQGELHSGGTVHIPPVPGFIPCLEYMCACMCTCMCVWGAVCECLGRCECINVYGMCVHVYVYVFMHMFMYACVSICMHKCACMCLCVGVCKQIVCTCLCLNVCASLCVHEYLCVLHYKTASDMGPHLPPGRGRPVLFLLLHTPGQLTHV